MQVVATVPDLITFLDAQSGCALGTPDYKYGLRVLVLGITAAPQWMSTVRGLELGDLWAFGYVLFFLFSFQYPCLAVFRPLFDLSWDVLYSFDDIPYVLLGEYIQPKSVID